MFYSQELIEEVREANPIEEVVNEYVPLKNSKGICPFHDDHNPSLSISPRKGIAKCFVCMSHAVDVFSWIMMMKKVSFPEAIRILADRKGIKIPDLTDEDKQMLAKQKRKEQILEETVNFYHNQLLSVMELTKGKEK